MSEKIHLRNVSGENFLIPEIYSKTISADPNRVWSVDKGIVDNSPIIQGLINDKKFVFCEANYKDINFVQKPNEDRGIRNINIKKEQNIVDLHADEKQNKLKKEEIINPVFSFGDVEDIVSIKSSKCEENLKSQIVMSKNIDKTKINVWWRGPANDMGGYGKMNRYCLEGLSKKDLHIHLDMHNIPSMRNTIPLSKNLEEMIENEVSVDAHSVWAIMPPKFPTRQGKIIYFTMLESGGAHPSFVKKLNNADEVWLPSKFNIDVLQKENLKAEIHHVPLGVDTNLYRPIEITFAQKNKFNIKTKGFVFLSVFGWSLRKGSDVLLKSYLKAFTKNDDTTLLIVSRLNGSSSVENIKRIRDEISQYIRTFCKDPSSHPHIVHIGVGIPEKEMPILYNMCDCFVLPSRGEGWCTLPNAEIKTPKGIVEIKDIKKEDIVFTHRGVESKVVETFKREYSGEMLKIMCWGRNNQYLYLTPNHNVRAIRSSNLSNKTIKKLLKNCSYDFEKDCLVYNNENSEHYKNEYTKYNLEWVSSKELKKGDLIFYPSVKYCENIDFIDLSKIFHITDRNEIRDNKVCKIVKNSFGKFKTDKVLFKKTKIYIDEDLMRLFGYYVAEGNSKLGGDICFSFSSLEKNYNKDVEYLMLKNFSLKRNKDQVENGKKSVILRFHNTVISSLFIHLFGHKARNKKIPNWFFNLNNNLKVEFLKGLFRGGGSFGKQRSQDVRSCDKVSLSTSSINLANQIFDLVQQLGISCVIKNRTIKNNKTKGLEKKYYSVQITNIKDYNDLAVKIKENNEKLFGKRDCNIFKTDKNFQLLKVRDVKSFDYDGDVYNFGVEGDNSYICNNYAVHNCLPATEAGACGLPVIMTRCGGQLDFLNDDNSYLIDIEGYGIEKQEIKDISSYYEDVPFAVLGSKSIDQLSEAMNNVYVNRAEAREKGQILMNHIKENFSWENTVNKIYDRLMAK